MYKRHQDISRQTGFVLVLALVMLAVLTLIGVSSMNSANMELKATANARQHLTAFAATQTALEYALSGPVVAGRVINYQDNDPEHFPALLTPDVSRDLGLTDASSARLEVRLTGCATAPGSSLEAGRGFSYSYFDIHGRASNARGTASARMVQGVRYPAAGCTTRM